MRIGMPALCHLRVHLSLGKKGGQTLVSGSTVPQEGGDTSVTSPGDFLYSVGRGRALALLMQINTLFILFICLSNFDT